MPAARRSFSSEVNVGLPKVTFRLVTRDAKFASDSPLEEGVYCELVSESEISEVSIPVRFWAILVS